MYSVRMRSGRRIERADGEREFWGGLGGARAQPLPGSGDGGAQETHRGNHACDRAFPRGVGLTAAQRRGATAWRGTASLQHPAPPVALLGVA
jgi:hypothetical protein